MLRMPIAQVGLGDLAIKACKNLCYTQRYKFSRKLSLKAVFQDLLDSFDSFVIIEESRLRFVSGFFAYWL